MMKKHKEEWRRRTYTYSEAYSSVFSLKRPQRLRALSILTGLNGVHLDMVLAESTRPALISSPIQVFLGVLHHIVPCPSFR